jgi:hypothetical protein
MSSKYPKADYRGTLNIGGVKIPCAVLDDGRRVISEHGATTALLGSRSGASKRLKKAQEGAGAPIPLFLAPRNLKKFVSNELEDGPLKPIDYLDGDRIVRGFDAMILPAACDVWLKAREAGELQDQQLDKAQRAEMLMRGLAQIGIIGLVDEATGYQEVRDRHALEAILNAYLRKELAAWAKRFPDEFYKEMFRLRGWRWSPMSVARPAIVGKYTNDLVYERLAPGIIDELQKRNPKDDQGRRKHHHHRWLTEDVGHPALAQHLHAVIGFMRAASGWDQFYRLMQRAFPKKGTTIELPLDD